MFRWLFFVASVTSLIVGCATSVLPTTTSDEILPPWVGTPAKGNPPKSDATLPAGINNGDIIFGDNLYYFIWNNTKSRVWFPATVSADELQSLPDDANPEPHLTGTTNPEETVGQLVLTDKGTVYWLDTVRGTKYRLHATALDYDELNSIPTAFGEQYYPVKK